MEVDQADSITPDYDSDDTTPVTYDAPDMLMDIDVPDSLTTNYTPNDTPTSLDITNDTITTDTYDIGPLTTLNDMLATTRTSQSAPPAAETSNAPNKSISPAQSSSRSALAEQPTNQALPSRPPRKRASQFFDPQDATFSCRYGHPDERFGGRPNLCQHLRKFHRHLTEEQAREEERVSGLLFCSKCLRPHANNANLNQHKPSCSGRQGGPTSSSRSRSTAATPNLLAPPLATSSTTQSTPTPLPSPQSNDRENITSAANGTEATTDKRCDPTTDEPGFHGHLNRLIELSSAPAIHGPLPPSTIRPFLQRVEQLAKAYAEAPAIASLAEILELPARMGLALEAGKADGLKRFLSTGEADRPPTTRQRRAEGTQTTFSQIIAKARSEVEQGRIGTASRTLTSQAARPVVDREVIESLRRKHPQRPTRSRYTHNRTPLASAPSGETIKKAIQELPRDTAVGLSNWSTSLLRLAGRNEAFIGFLQHVCRRMLLGTQPGHSLLCSARLIALAKPGGGTRPIAIGDLIYRTCAKAILSENRKANHLSKRQFGVGSKGGIEPIVHITRMAVNHQLSLPYTHLTSLDVSNAFNELDRTIMLDAVKKYAPELLKLAVWMYDSESALVITDDDSTPHIIKSSQGIRQGDPLGPLLFSIAIRDLVDGLQQHLGPGTLVLAYLDDIFILSLDDTPLAKCLEYFPATRPDLRLNAQKCKMIAIEEIKKEGFQLLGSAVGPVNYLRSFLQAKVDASIEQFRYIRNLPKQHALLCLRLSFQNQLRHLLRTLPVEGLRDIWQRLDTALREELKTIRGPTEDLTTVPQEDVIVSLPLRYGGCGFLSHSDLHEHAYQASLEESSILILPLSDNIATPEKAKPQKERTDKVHQHNINMLCQSLPEKSRFAFRENGTPLSRKWMASIPSSRALLIDDEVVAIGLCVRTLASSRRCNFCGTPTSFLHFESCEGNVGEWTARHEKVKRAVANMLRTVPGGKVEEEPWVNRRLLTPEEKRNRRNDIRIRGQLPDGMREEDYDVKVTSLFATENHLINHVRRPQIWTPEEIDRRMQVILTRHHNEKLRKLRYRSEAGQGMQPIVMSSGGVMSEQLDHLIRGWKKGANVGAMGFMFSRISIGLLEERTKYWFT